MFFGMPGIDHIRELGSSNCAFLHGEENTLIALLLFVIGRPPDFSHTERVLLLCVSALVHGRNEDEVLRCCTGIFFFALLLSFFFAQNWWCGKKSSTSLPRLEPSPPPTPVRQHTTEPRPPMLSKGGFCFTSGYTYHRTDGTGQIFIPHSQWEECGTDQ